MKSLVRFSAAWLLLESAACLAQTAFSSLYIFGDGVSTTTNNSQLPAYYYGHRYCNGRVWVEVLAQWQGLAYDSNKNWSYFGHYSPDLVTNVTRFAAPPDANSALFVVWVNDADFVYDISNYDPYTTKNIAVWTNAINQSLSNHLKAIQILYAKGARTFVMPNAADITRVPFYAGLPASNRSFIRQRIIDFNASFATLLEQARISLPGISLYMPDVFALLDNILADPGNYGLTNALDNGLSIDAISDPALKDKSLNGPGANYIFWDYLDPSAKFQMWIADAAQQLISPARIDGITTLNGSNLITMVNIPIGRDGRVESSPDFSIWTTLEDFDSTNAAQSIFVPVAGPLEFYRLRFPSAWSWP